MDLQGLLVASPGNPTGTMLDHAAMSALIDATQAQGASFISDEIYHGIEYEKKAVTALEITDDVYVINSFSKYFSMTGWRVGWMVVPEDHVRVVERIAQNMFICAPHASQVAALAAMDCTDELEANMDVYRANRAMMITGLREAGFTRFAPPDGAFYVYADVSELTDDSRALARDILDKAGVAVTPGLDFDPVRGHHWLRFSYARSTQDIAEGCYTCRNHPEQNGDRHAYSSHYRNGLRAVLASVRAGSDRAGAGGPCQKRHLGWLVRGHDADAWAEPGGAVSGVLAG